MRVQVEISAEIKILAEAQAVGLGYPSLAIMLRVVTAGLARDYQASTPISEVATPGSTSATQAAIPASTQPPPPEQFKNWPPYASPSIAQTDPNLYRFYIETGVIS